MSSREVFGGMKKNMKRGRSGPWELMRPKHGGPATISANQTNRGLTGTARTDCTVDQLCRDPGGLLLR